jgi:hypothetical protein
MHTRMWASTNRQASTLREVANLLLSSLRSKVTLAQPTLRRSLQIGEACFASCLWSDRREDTNSPCSFHGWFGCEVGEEAMLLPMQLCGIAATVRTSYALCSDGVAFGWSWCCLLVARPYTDRLTSGDDEVCDSRLGQLTLDTSLHRHGTGYALWFVGDETCRIVCIASVGSFTVQYGIVIYGQLKHDHYLLLSKSEGRELHFRVPT